MRYIILSVAALLITNSVFADSKISTVDVNRVINESKEAQTKKKELDAKSLDIKKKIEERKAALIDFEKKLKAQKTADSSPEAEKFRVQAKDYERFVRDSEEDLKKQFFKLNKDITDRALRVIATYASEHSIELVLEKGEKAQSSVLFSDSSHDITEEILKRFNS